MSRRQLAWKPIFGFLFRIALITSIWSAPNTALSADALSWANRLRKDVETIDTRSSGSIGLFVQRLASSHPNQTLGIQADRPWYLASTIKILVAIAVLQEKVEGRLTLDEQIEVKETDGVDGNGQLLIAPAGTRVSIERLIELMLIESDSTATDLLIRRIGESQLNVRIAKMAGDNGFGPITTLLQVRYDAYGEVHPKAQSLTNRDFIALKSYRETRERLKGFAAKIKVPVNALKAPTLEEAFERYYAKGKNSGTLEAFGRVLEKLVRNELLPSNETRRLLQWMESIKTGEKRIKAGLPIGARFAQKTGTQLRRLCNVGVIRPGQGSEDPLVIVAVCIEKFEDQDRAERTLQEVGRAIGRSGVLLGRTPSQG